jgi:N-sulfoglucosamine sulfohydrolase
VSLVRAGAALAQTRNVPLFLDERVAQLVEHRTFNPVVAGSIPAPFTIFYSQFPAFCTFSQVCGCMTTQFGSMPVSKSTRRSFLKSATAATVGTLVAGSERDALAAPTTRPNILFAIADDWSWPFASIYGTKGLQTPAFDRIAREGCLFTNAFCAAPQCSPNRAAILTGKNIWQLEEAGTHGSLFPTKFRVYPDILEEAGYHVGFTSKGWGPGDWKTAGRPRNPVGREYSDKKFPSVPTNGMSAIDYAENFVSFLSDRPKGSPFCFWYGCHEPHRKYKVGSGIAAGKKLEDAFVPPFLPDNETVRGDILDYYIEIEWFDKQLGAILEQIEAAGELDNTLIVVTGDNGMSWPSAKANVYEYGVHVPMAVRWPGHVQAGMTFPGLVSHTQIAPALLEAAGLSVPPDMNRINLLRMLQPGNTIMFDEFVVFGRERHSHARHDLLGYPARAMRSHEFLYIRNFKPDRWPAGDPPKYYDIDDGSTKQYMMEHRGEIPELFAKGFEKRPEEEFYDVKKDPGCLVNLAINSEFDSRRNGMADALMKLLTEQKDPRALGSEIFDSYPRMGATRPELGGFSEPKKYNPAFQTGTK